MATKPADNSHPDGEAIGPLWLGSTVRRGATQAHGAGWKEKEGEDAAQPRWLGSLVRRDGARTEGTGWVPPEQAEGPRWLGSLARRGEKYPAVERPEPGVDSVRPLHLVDLAPEAESAPAESEQPKVSTNWQGSDGRARLNTVRDTEPETTPEPPLPSDELGERREERFVIGALGMRLRVVA